ncbi:YcaO-like family protein [Paenibacillus sp. ISL-20]|nr:YcaO-like family protein [Paenibacillus sp. ISL-20]
MIHITRSLSHFNIPYKAFLNDNYYKTFSYIGNFKIGEYKGPSGCNSISNNKVLSLKKSFSESLERRALMLGGCINSNGKVNTFDLLSKNINELPIEYSKYKASNPMCSDTTGTAAHTNSEQAIKNALLELIGKNALFLFWYGKQGSILDRNLTGYEYEIQKLHREGKNLKLFVNTYFSPAIAVFAFIFDEHCIYASGVGTSLVLEDSITAAIEEAFLLKWQNEVEDMRNYKKVSTIDYKYHGECLKYLEESFKDTYIEEPIKNKNGGVDELLLSFPTWVEELHAIFLRNSIKSNLKIVKIFSKNLNNHIPIKQRINVDQTINKKTINLTESDLYNIPDCIII